MHIIHVNSYHLGADYKSDFVCDFMCDLQQIAHEITLEIARVISPLCVIHVMCHRTFPEIQ
jgi:hypothetical protein